MLCQLSIRNFALISGADIAFSDGFTTITGETGSGKSIMLGALNLILGERADYSVIRDPEKKTVVEAVFRIGEEHRDWFASEDIDWDSETVIRREITAQGKSRAFINDTPVQLGQLKTLTEQLIYIHSQHQTLELRKPLFQLSLVDAYAGITEAVEHYRKDFYAYRRDQQRLEGLKEQLSGLEQEADYIRFQLQELDALELEKQDYAALEDELNRLERLDDLKIAYDALASGLTIENGPADGLQRIRQLTEKWKASDAQLEVLSDRLNSVIIELDDISVEAASALEALEPDPERQQMLMTAVDRYNNALRKHHLASQEELLALAADYRDRFENTGALEEEIASLSMALSERLSALITRSEAFHVTRRKAATELEKHLLGLMKDLKLPDARLVFEVTEKDEPDANGKSVVQLLFSANAGMEPKPVDKAASGGELSRLMLAVQATLSHLKSLPTLILDEIDTGVSGEVALRIGKLLREMGENMQLFAITHLPQVAAKGQQQLEVAKSRSGDETITVIRPLSNEERTDAIARLMSGDVISEASVASARQLLE